MLTKLVKIEFLKELSVGNTFLLRNNAEYVHHETIQI